MIARDSPLGWADSAIAGSADPNSAADLVLRRHAANTLALVNGAAAQAFRVYNTKTDDSNGEWFNFRWNSNTLEFGTEFNGTGQARDLLLVTGGSGRWRVKSTGHLLAALDNAYDIGQSDDFRPRNIYWRGTIQGPAGSLGAPSISFLNDATMGFYRVADGIIGVSSVLHFTERAAPAAPDGNQAVLFARDNGAGKTQLCAMFTDGVVIPLATQA